MYSRLSNVRSMFCDSSQGALCQQPISLLGFYDPFECNVRSMMMMKSSDDIY